MTEKIYLTKLQVRRQFLALIIIKAIIILFYKATRNAGRAFNQTTNNFFEPFCAKMLTFLFAIVHCSIRKYESVVKVVRLFIGKITQSVYFLCIIIYRYGCTNIDDRYVYINPLAVV